MPTRNQPVMLTLQQQTTACCVGEKKKSIRYLADIFSFFAF